MTVALAVVDPVAFVAVNVYIVVLFGVTARLVPVTAPMPWSIDSVVAPVTVQFNVAEAPLAIDTGVALNAVMFGAAAGGAEEPPEEPAELEAPPEPDELEVPDDELPEDELPDELDDAPEELDEELEDEPEEPDESVLELEPPALDELDEVPPEPS